ncbi:hypothetical protein D9619_010052 [Psilocybe cf. subviscida]|uniref:F-box domain-containing protein n=1 Tax=Psilocybe cf. subviscida TaxID=2480587 RepID=A0A8H5BL42_9AGAR|nr:hypothetical protein D9619_010052 [Psilocybe cf. subviscida]
MDKRTHSELVQRPKDEDLTIHAVIEQAEEPPSSGNRCTHISKLPNETLLVIFMVMKDDKGSVSAIARTCHHWRSLVIGAPLFWTNIRGFKHKYTLLLLDRSKLAPLDVEFDSFTPTATILATLNHFERIRTLSIGWQSATSALNKAQELLSNLNREAILLEDLSIGACTDRSEHFTFSFDAFRLTSRLHTLPLRHSFRLGRL